MSAAETITQADFEEKVIKSDRPVLVDFWAEWCGPCKAIGPILDELAGELGETAKIVKVNVEDDPELAQKYGIKSIPTMIFFKDGKVAKSLLGAQSKEEIAKNIQLIS